MIDTSKMGRDFMPRRRRLEEEGFASPVGHVRPDTQAAGLPPGVQMQTEEFTPPPGGGQGQFSFTPLGGGSSLFGTSTGQPPGVSTGQPPPPGQGLYGLGYDTSQFRGGGQPPPIQPPGPAIPGGPGQPPTGGYGGPGQPPTGGGPGTGVDYTVGGGGQPGAGAPEAGGFPYPEQWQQAGDIYGQLAGGMPGMPDPGAMWGGYEQQAGDLSRELAEQAGMGMGSRYGSALQRNIADVGMRAGERFGGEMERMRMGDVAGQRQAMLGAAGGLSGLGGAQAMLPGQLAGQAMGLGSQYQQMQQMPLTLQREEWLRQQPEYSPYLPYMQQGAQVPYGVQTYQPGFGSNMLDIGGMMGMYGMMNPQGQEQSWLTRPW